MRRVFLTILGKIKERTIYDPNIFGCGEGRGGGRQEEGRKGGEGKEGRGGEGEKKGSYLEERGGRRLKMVMDIEVEEGDGEKKGGVEVEKGSNWGRSGGGR